MQDTEQNSLFDTLYRKNVNTVYNVALSFMKNPSEAEDITSDVFVQLLESGMSFTDEGHARAWLITVTRNRC